MTHLLAIAVGPVQEFIAAARRTRDLWFGSHLLSEISRAVAAAVQGRGRLIFPARIDAPNVANVILAELHPEEDPAWVAALARSEGETAWHTSFAGPAFKECQSIIRTDIWNDQVDDVIEFYAAWTPRTDDYPADRRRVMRLLAGRKACRDFRAAKGRVGVPKSSLDGLRETVLKDPVKEPWPALMRARLRIRKGEQLDVVGVVKRVSGGTKKYPSVSRIAADPWIRGRVGKLGALIAECERLEYKVVRRLDVSDEGHPHYRDFPFEGSALYLSRHHELMEETESEGVELQPLAQTVARLGEPSPYLAVLMADGDRMGETLTRLSTADEHRDFSVTLARFADQARGIVHDHQGVLVYAGGDDVLAFLPVDRCIECARSLHDTFGNLLQEWSNRAGTKITLSVGMAIGHFLENLEDLRAYALAAEKHAKMGDASGTKDALAVHLYKRGGAPIRVRAPWTDSPDLRLREFAKWLNEKSVSSRLAVDLSRMADLYEQWQGDGSEAILKDLLRVMRAKQPGGEEIPESIKKTLKERVTDYQSLRQVSEELLIARLIAVAYRQAAGRETGGGA